MGVKFNNKIANMSVICAILVVCIHTTSDSLFWQRWIVGGLAQIAVPYFFVVSGYFFGSHIGGASWWKDGLLRRIRTLVMPFFMLNTMFFVLKYGMHWIGCRYFGAISDNPIMDITIKNFLICISPIPTTGFPVVGPLWYVRALMYLILCSPLYVGVIRKAQGLAFCFLIAIFALMCTQSAYFQTDVFEFRLYCLFYFCLGISIARWHWTMPSHVPWRLLIALGVSLMVISKSLVDTSVVHNVLFQLSIMLMILSVWNVVPDCSWPTWIATNTFPIYVLHVMIIFVLHTLFRTFHLSAIAASWIGVCFLVPFYTICSCLFAMLIKKRFNRLSAMIFGGR